MNAIFRVVTRIQDQDDFSGNLTDGEFLRYNSSTDKFELQSVSPGGDSGQIQYNNNGTFAGVDHSSIGISGDIFKLSSLAVSDIPFVVKGFSGQTANLTEWRNNSDAILARFDSSGNLFTGAITASRSTFASFAPFITGLNESGRSEIELQQGLIAGYGGTLTLRAGDVANTGYVRVEYNGGYPSITTTQQNFNFIGNGFRARYTNAYIDMGGASDATTWLYLDGSTNKSRAANGFKSRNLNDSADAPITCGAITASDYIYGTSAQFSALGAFGGYGVGSATLAVQALNSVTVGINIRGQSGQTSDLLKCKTSANTDVFTVGPTGAITTSKYVEATEYLISNQGRVFSRANGSAGFLLGASDDCNVNRISAGVIGFGTGSAGSTAAEIRCGAITASGTVTISATTQLALTNSAGVQRATINDYGSSIRFQASSSGYPIHLQGNNHGIRVGNGTYTVDIKPVASNSVIGFYTGQGTTAASGALADIACGAITASGVITAGGVGFNCPADQYYLWNGRSAMNSPADGVIRMTDSTGTTFSRLQLGGTTSSFPAIKRFGTTTAFRLADDSADGPITASTGTFSTSVVTAQLAVSGTAGNDFGILSGTSTRLRLGRISTGTTVMLLELTSNGGGGVTLARGGQIQWSGSTASAEGGGTTACLVSNAAGIVSVQDGAGGAGALTCGAITASGLLNVQNSTTPTEFNLHNTYTSATSREYLKMLAVTGGAYQIGSAIGSAGGSNRAVELGHYNSAGTFTSALSIATSGAITTTGDITLAASQRLFVSNGATTGNYLLSGATAVFANNSVAQGGWNTNGMYARRLFIDYANEDICLARASTSNLGIYAGDGTTPAAITCGAITASGSITSSGTAALRAFFQRSASTNASIAFGTTTTVAYLGVGATNNVAMSANGDLTSSPPFTFNISNGNLTASGTIVATGNVSTNSGHIASLASGQNMFLLNSAGTYYGSIGNDAGDKWSLGYKSSSTTTLGTPVLTWTGSGRVGINNISPAAALDVTGAITASGHISTTGSINATSIMCDGSTVFDTYGYRLDCGVGGGFNTLTVPAILQIGGTTSAYPSWKRSGTTLSARLADDSADAPISCGAITASGLVTVDSLCSSSLVHPSRYVYLNSSAMYPGSNNMGLGTSGNPWGASYFGAITASGAVTAVADDFYVSDSGTYYFSNVSRNRGMLISSGSGGRIGFKAGGTEWLQISDAGAITASGAIKLTDGTYTAHLIPFTSAGNNAILVRNSTNTGNGNFQANDGLFATLRSMGAVTIEGAITSAVPTATTKNLVLRSTDDTYTQPFLEFQNAVGTMLHKITGSTATFGNLIVTTGVTFVMCNVGATGYYQWGNRSIVYAPATGQFSFRNIAETAGATLDVTTDGTLTIKDRAGTATGNLSCGAATVLGKLKINGAGGSGQNSGEMSFGTSENQSFGATGTGAGSVGFYWTDRNADSATSIGGSYNALNLATAGAKIFQWKAASVEKAYISVDGSFVTSGAITASGEATIGTASDASDTGGVVTIRRWRHPSLILDANTAQGSFWGLSLRVTGTEKTGLKVDNSSGEVRWNVSSGGYYPTIYSNGVQRMVINTAGDTSFAGAITASGNINIGPMTLSTGRQGMAIYSQGMFAINGDAQKVLWVLCRKTTDATPTTLMADGSSTRLTIPSGKTMSCKVTVKGIKSDGSAKARFVRLVEITNVGGTTALDMSPEALGTDYNPSGCACDITADDTNDALNISVTGIVAETWRWVAIVEGLEIAYGT